MTCIPQIVIVPQRGTARWMKSYEHLARVRTLGSANFILEISIVIAEASDLRTAATQTRFAMGEMH